MYQDYAQETYASNKIRAFHLTEMLYNQRNHNENQINADQYRWEDYHSVKDDDAEEPIRSNCIIQTNSILAAHFSNWHIFSDEIFVLNNLLTCGCRTCVSSEASCACARAGSRTTTGATVHAVSIAIAVGCSYKG